MQEERAKGREWHDVQSTEDLAFGRKCRCVAGRRWRTEVRPARENPQCGFHGLPVFRRQTRDLHRGTLHLRSRDQLLRLERPPHLRHGRAKAGILGSQCPTPAPDQHLCVVGAVIPVPEQPDLLRRGCGTLHHRLRFPASTVSEPCCSDFVRSSRSQPSS